MDRTRHRRRTAGSRYQTESSRVTICTDHPRWLGGAFGLCIAEVRTQNRESRKFVRCQVQLGSTKAVFGIDARPRAEELEFVAHRWIPSTKRTVECRRPVEPEVQEQRAAAHCDLWHSIATQDP